MYDLLPVSWSRSGAPALRCTICCWCLRSGAPALRCMICCLCLGLEVVPSTKMYDLLLVSWSRSPSTKMCRLLPVSWSRSGAPALRYTMRFRCLGLEVVPQHKHVRFVAGNLVSKWHPSTKMYDLLPVSWSRSGAPALRCTICCRCLGLEVVPQH